MKLSPAFKLFLDFLPLGVFFACFKWLDLYAATFAIVIVTLLSLAIIYLAERRLALAPLITAIVVGVAGGLTLWLHDERYIKMKPTIINLVFAAILLGGALRGKGLLRHVLGMGIAMNEAGWLILSRRFGVFFLALAALNEIIWRNFSTGIWVDFKVFGLMGLTMLFAVTQAGVIDQHSVKK